MSTSDDFWDRYLKRLGKILYFAILIGILAWSLPFFQYGEGDTNLGTQIRRISGPFFRWTGLWQGWSMFAPNPADQNIALQVAIEFHDGTFEFINWPVIHQQDGFAAYQHERHRKYLENITQQSNAAAWPQLAEYYRSLYEPKRYVKRIDIVHWWSDIPAPSFEGTPLLPPTSINYESSRILHTALYNKP